MKKVLFGAAVALQSPFVAGLTLADKIAWLLREGIDTAKETGEWVMRIMRKIMQALQMTIVESIEKMTQNFMRNILEQLMQKINKEAARAIKFITDL